MAAPMLTSVQVGKSIKSVKQQKKTRNVLMTPYEIVWPDIERRIQLEIRGKLKTVFAQLGLKKERMPWILGTNKNALLNKIKAERSTSATDASKFNNLRAQLKIGVNAVTRTLERDGLRLVVVDQSAEPPILTKHLLQMAAVRLCNIVRIPGLTDTIAPLLGVTSLTALGFKKATEGDAADFEELLDFVGSRCPKLNIPWLQKDPVQKIERGDTKRTEESMDTDKHSDDKKETSKSGGGHLIRNETETPIDFSSIYVKKTDSSLINGKVDKRGFGMSGFVAFGEQSSDDNEVEERKPKKTRSKRKHPSSYFSPSIGKMQGNKDRPIVKTKKKRVT